jgi:hypothetical protein
MSIGAILGAGLLWALPMRDPDYEEPSMVPVGAAID